MRLCTAKVINPPEVVFVLDADTHPNVLRPSSCSNAPDSMLRPSIRLWSWLTSEPLFHSVLVEDVVDYTHAGIFLGSEKQVVDDGVGLGLHGHRLWHTLEPGLLDQPLSKRLR